METFLKQAVFKQIHEQQQGQQGQGHYQGQSSEQDKAC